MTIRQYREENLLSLQELADLVDSSKSSIQNWENGLPMSWKKRKIFRRSWIRSTRGKAMQLEFDIGYPKLSTKTPFLYLGSKTRSRKRFMELLPDDVDKMISPFIGGGAIEFILRSTWN